MSSIIPGTVVVNFPSFIRLKRATFEQYLSNSSPAGCVGWLVRFDTSANPKLVFKDHPSYSTTFEIEITQGTDYTFVNQALDEVNWGQFFPLFPNEDIAAFQIGQPNFFFLSKDDLFGMYGVADYFFLSRLEIDYGTSSLFTFDANDPNHEYAPYQDGKFPSIKVEAKQIDSNINSANNPIEAMYIIAPPCPPKWNPSFFSGPQK